MFGNQSGIKRNSLENEEIDYESDVVVHTDGRTYTVPAGTQIRLTPGESIHIQQFRWKKGQAWYFWEK